MSTQTDRTVSEVSLHRVQKELAALVQENERLRAACQKAYHLSAMRSEPYIPPDIRALIEATLQAALEGKEGTP